MAYLSRVTRNRRTLNRRTFLAAGAMAGVGGAWLASSDSWTARFFRARAAEMGRAVARAPHKPAPVDWSDNALTIAWLGHASVLINFFGVRLLTDPTFFSRCGVSAGPGTIGPKRFVACALKPAELPEIDVVLVSHAHFDHLDIPSLSAVRGKPVAIMARATSDLLPRRTYSAIHELGWSERLNLSTRRGAVSVRAIEVKHWGARLRRDTYRGYSGYVIEREGKKLLFGGDTANTLLFAEYRQQGPFEAAIMPIGAYDPWIRSHCTPEQAAAMANAAGARLFVPVHHQCFKLSNEPMNEPIQRAMAAFANEPERLALREVGQTVVIT